jgi:RimJ/RimL family protein N-acetyltransferase
LTRRGALPATQGGHIGPQVPALETERLLLRPFRPGDIDDYAALNAEVLRHVGSGPEQPAKRWPRIGRPLQLASVGSGLWPGESMLDTPIKIMQARVLQTLDEMRQVVHVVGKRTSVCQILCVTDVA